MIAPAKVVENEMIVLSLSLSVLFAVISPRLTAFSAYPISSPTIPPTLSITVPLQLTTMVP